MVDQCLGKPCVVCRQRIAGTHQGCRHCNFCGGLTCGTGMGKLECPKCGRRIRKRGR